MPVYNASKFLREAVDSILAQTFTDFELVIINDGSEDDSDEIIKSYSDPRIKYINNSQNQGIVKSLNQAVESSCGKYIARMDADDIAYSDRLKIQVGYLENNKNIKLLGARVRLIDDNGIPFDHWNYPTTIDGVKEAIKHSCCFSHPSVMLERTVFDEFNGYDINYQVAGEDYDLWIKILNKYDGLNLDMVLTDYRIHSTNFSTTNLLKQVLACLAIQKQIPVGNSVTADMLLEKGIEPQFLNNLFVDAFVFWIEIYRKMRAYDVCIKLFDNLNAALIYTGNNEAIIKLTKYKLHYNIKTLNFLKALILSLKIFQQKIIKK